MIKKGLFIPDLTHTMKIRQLLEYDDVIQEEVDKPKLFIVLDLDDSLIAEVNSIEEGVEEFIKLHPHFERHYAKVFVFPNTRKV